MIKSEKSVGCQAVLFGEEGTNDVLCEEETEEMISTDVRNMIPQIKTFFAGQPVKRAWLFGSCSRGEERADSDIDILVQYENSKEMSLYRIAAMMCALEDIIHKEVDLIEYDRLLPFAVESAERDKILIYERED